MQLTVQVGPRAFRLHRTSGVDRLLERMPDGPDPVMPYWAHLWPAAHGLARHLLERAPLSGTAIELGCGLGLAGLAAAAAGLDVTLTDVEPRALALARRSAIASGLAVRWRRLDWRDPGAVERYDYVLGADLLYEETLHEPLLSLLPRLVAPGGRVLLADPSRSVAERFCANLHDAFTVTTLVFPVELEGTRSRIRLLELAPDAG